MKLMFPKNKWFIAFVIAAVVALAGIITAIIIGVNSAPPEYVEGDEIGIYYYDTAEGEMLLTLSGGNNFTLAGTTTNKTGTYTVDGKTITLDFVKESDGTATATIDGDRISLVYNGATLPFTAKVNYTVTFDGTDFPAATVVNGKTVAKPADPTKENNIFFGWYADAAYTTPYDFDATMIKADTKIYAKWVEGTFDYTVNFELGYEGAEIESLQAISGKLYGVPAPERTGYVFGGWYFSVYEDAAKPTSLYTDSTVITKDTTLYAVWYEASATALAAPAVSVSDSMISWNAVPNASGYKLTVIGPDGTAVIDNETVGTTNKAFDFASKDAGDYTISVVAVASNADNNSPAAVRYYANKALDKVTTFHVENGILIFGAVKNAEKYVIKIACGNANHSHDAIDNGPSTTYYLGNCTMQKGGILITVTASANGFAPSTSATYSYEKTLAAIDAVTHNAAADNVSWAPVAGAANYKVIVTVGENTYTYDNGTYTIFSVANFSGEFTVSVIPETDGYNSPDATVVNITKTAPAAPGNLASNSMVITWDAVAGAASYEVNIDGQTAITTTNSIDLTALATPLVQGKAYTIKVRAFNADDEGSSYSETITLGYNIFEGALSYNKNTVSWSPVLAVGGTYEVRVNGGEAIVVENAYSAKVVLTQEGENIIEVRFVSDSYTSDWKQITVTAYTIEYDSRSTAHGIIGYEYIAYGDVLTPPTSADIPYPGFNFDNWYSAPKGNGKQYTAGSVFSGSAYTVVYANWVPITYDLIVNVDGLDVVNFKTGDVLKAMYSLNFTLPVATYPNVLLDAFTGWFTGPSGTGVQLTDAEGKSIAPYQFTDSVTIYPCFVNQALEYTLNADGKGYSVKKGVAIGEVTSVTIPTEIDGLPVTAILESGFLNCSKLVEVNIPESIKLVGLKAFRGCSKLENINVYEVEDFNDKPLYFDIDGALIRDDLGLGTLYLEVLPQGKTGSYTIPEEVSVISEQAFYQVKITSITIPATINVIPRYAFYNCQDLTEIVIAGQRTTPIQIEGDAFYMSSTTYKFAVTSITLPANFNLTPDSAKVFLDRFVALTSITVEDNGAKYSSIGGILTDESESIIYYCPKAYAGEYTVPNGISTIYASAFEGREAITAVTIPAGVTSIGDKAFASCFGLEKITIEGSRPDDLAIGNEAFAYHRALETIVFEANESGELDTGKITIGESAFAAGANYRALESVVIGAGTNIETVGKAAFKNNSYLESISISDKARVNTIAENAFENCSFMTEISIPATTTSIAPYAFSNCTALRNVNFKTDGATALDISEYAFYGCTALSSILLPDHLNEFKSSAFDGCEALKEIKVNPTNPKYVSDDNGILYKRAAEGAAVTDLLFYPKGLTKELGGIITNLPETLTTIGGAAFSNNIYVVSVTIPKSVTTIDNAAFANCSHLKTLVFAEGGTSLTIGERAFENCSELDDTFKLPSYTTSIGNFAFANCDFTTFTVPAQVGYLGAGAFMACDFLNTVKFETTVPLVIGVKTGAADPQMGAFANCRVLSKVELPASLVDLGKYTFYSCRALETVTIAPGASLETIGEYAFYGCTALKSIFVPKTVTVIGSYAFGMYEGKENVLTDVIFELGGTETLNIAINVFAYANHIEKITFPARVSFVSDTINLDSGDKDEIGNPIYNAPTPDWVINMNKANTAATLEAARPKMLKDTFTGCTSLAEINIADESIEGLVKKYSSLDGVVYNADKTVLIYCPSANKGIYVDGEPTYEIKIPTSVKLVGIFAFYDLTNLKTITFVEFSKTDADYATQLLTIGNAENPHATSYSYIYNFPTIGGNTSSLTAINLPSHLARVRAGAFASKSTTAMDLTFSPDANNLIFEDYAFFSSRAKAIVIPHVKSMGSYTFASSEFLAKLEVGIDESIIAIPDYYVGMINTKNEVLKSYDIPNHITKIGSNAFTNCTALESIELHEGLLELGHHAFCGAGLTEVTIPSTITNASWSSATYVFSECRKLEKVTFALNADGKSNITAIPNSAFSLCDKLTTINLTDLALTSIGNYAFQNCESLKDVDFTKLTALNTLGTSAFDASGFIRVDLSKTKITKFSTEFSHIPGLELIILPDTVVTFSATRNTPLSLQKLVIGKGADATDITTLTDLGNLLSIEVPEDHPSLIKENGIIYDKNKQTIVFADRYSDFTDYVMPETVTKIESCAFVYSTFGDLFVSDKVSAIGTYAFQYATINSISLPAALTKIDTNTFMNSTLKAVTFRDEANSKLTNIAGNAFAGTQLVTFDMPDSVTTLTNSAFNNIATLKSFTFGAKLATIPSSAVFKGCTALETIIIQEGTTTINALFQLVSATGATLLESNQVKEIYIPASVTKLANAAFAGFANLEKVTFAEGSELKDLGNFVFYGCESLKSITLPATVATIGTYTFEGCTSLKSADLSATQLTTTGNYTFMNTPALESVAFPKAITTIGINAFMNSGIVELNVPTTVTTISANAFENSGLVTVTFPANSQVTVIASEAFKNTKSLETVTIHNSLTSIGAGAFEGSTVKTVALVNPEAAPAITSVGDNAFRDCVNLTAFDLLEKATYIGNFAFLNCSSLKSAALGNNVRTIGTMAFGFTNLDVAHIPASVISLGGNPYAGIDKTKITLDAGNSFYSMVEENGVKYVYDIDGFTLYAAYGATGDYVIGEHVYNMAPGAFAGTKIASVVIPKRFTNITEMLFMNCSDLVSVTFEFGVETIGNYAFSGTKLQTVEFVGSIYSVGNYAFSNCAELNNVVIPATLLNLGDGVFAYCAALDNVDFVDHENFVTLGSHLFYYCTSLKEVALPTHFKVREDVAYAMGVSPNATTKHFEYALPPHTFSGSGIVHAVLDYVDMVIFTQGPAFADCKSLETVTFKTGLAQGIPNPHTLKSGWFTGCDNLKAVYLEYVGGIKNVDNFDANMTMIKELYDAGIREIHIKAINFDYYNGNYNWSAIGDDLKLYFDTNSYMEIVEFFKYGKKTVAFDIYDKDGNLVKCAEDSGIVSTVVDPEGNVIYTNPVTAPEVHPDDESDA